MIKFGTIDLNKDTIKGLLFDCVKQETTDLKVNTTKLNGSIDRLNQLNTDWDNFMKTL